MNRLIFEWDNEKNRIKKKKHSVSFEEAKSVFYDDNAIQFWDEDNSDAEDRFLLLGKGISCQELIILYLQDCVASKRELSFD
ncbi:MAG: BrnT family toxin [Xenococcaceae cyanobacterium]